MRNFSLLFAIVALFSGCYTAKTANRQIIRAHSEHPEISSAYCGLWYPIRIYDSTVIKYLPGSTTYRYDTVTVDCDTVVVPGKPTTVKVPCPPCPQRVDTVYINSDKLAESSALLEAEKYRREAVQKENAELSAELTNQIAKKNMFMWLAIAGCGYTLLRLFLKKWINLP